MLFYKIQKSGLYAEQQKPIPVVFEEVKLECGYRIDILVEGKLVLEIKSVEAVHPVFFAQTLTYLRLGGFKLGLLMNFNVPALREGVKRIINGTSTNSACVLDLFFTFLILLISFVSIGCGPNEEILKSNSNQRYLRTDRPRRIPNQPMTPSKPKSKTCERPISISYSYSPERRRRNAGGR